MNNFFIFISLVGLTLFGCGNLFKICILENKTLEIEKRVLVLETKLQVYSGVCSNG